MALLGRDYRRCDGACRSYPVLALPGGQPDHFPERLLLQEHLLDTHVALPLGMGRTRTPDAVRPVQHLSYREKSTGIPARNRTGAGERSSKGSGGRAGHWDDGDSPASPRSVARGTARVTPGTGTSSPGRGAGRFWTSDRPRATSATRTRPPDAIPAAKRAVPDTHCRRQTGLPCGAASTVLSRLSKQDSAAMKITRVDFFSECGARSRRPPPKRPHAPGSPAFQ